MRTYDPGRYTSSWLLKGSLASSTLCVYIQLVLGMKFSVLALDTLYPLLLESLRFVFHVVVQALWSVGQMGRLYIYCRSCLSSRIAWLDFLLGLYGCVGCL